MRCNDEVDCLNIIIDSVKVRDYINLYVLAILVLVSLSFILFVLIILVKLLRTYRIDGWRQLYNGEAQEIRA